MAENTSIVDQIRGQEQKSEEAIEKAKDGIELELQDMRMEHEKSLGQLEEAIKNEKVAILETAKGSIQKKKTASEKNQKTLLETINNISAKDIDAAADIVTASILEQA
ncbi:MAG: hypothetical protein ABIG66_04870 [Candidatus Kerfeldbacteria bacterium]